MNRIVCLMETVTLVALAAVACSDVDKSGVMGPGAATPGDRVSNASSSLEKADWAGYAADVETVLQLGGAKPVTYRSHFERRLDANDRWLTRVTLPPKPGLEADTRAGEMVATVEMSDDGKVTGVFDREGRAISLAKLMEGTLPRASETRSLGFPQMPAKRGRAEAKSDRHAWLDDAVLTPAAAERIAQRLSKHMLKVGELNGAKRFVRPGAVTAEALVDATTGAVVEENAYHGTKRLYHATHSYSRLPNGPLVRTHSRVQYDPDGAAGPIVVERNLTNVKLTAGGLKR